MTVTGFGQCASWDTQRLGALHRQVVAETLIVTIRTRPLLAQQVAYRRRERSPVGRWLCRTPPWLPSSVEQISIYPVHAKPPRWDPRPFISIACARLPSAAFHALVRTDF
jgi:hypothetical protein